MLHVSFRAALLISAGAAFLHAQPSPTPLVISERIGSVLGNEDRAYFGLFPDFHSFDSAAFFADGAEHIICTILRANAPDTAIEFPSADGKILAGYIDDYESVDSGMYLQRKPVYTKLIEAGVLPRAIPAMPVDVPPARIYPRDGSAFQAILLALDDSVIVYWRANKPVKSFDPCASSIGILRVRDVRRLSFGSPSTVGEAVMAGLLIACASYPLWIDLTATSSNSGTHLDIEGSIIRSLATGLCAGFLTEILLSIGSPPSGYKTIGVDSYTWHSTALRFRSLCKYSDKRPPELRRVLSGKF